MVALGSSRIEATIARLITLHPTEMDFSLDRIKRILVDLGSPERRLPPVIHVAGTNGKGSTVAFCRAMLEASGQRVHVSTSPHLVDIRERFRIGAAGGGRLVEEAMFLAALERVEAANRGQLITLFEILTAASFLMFADEPADAVILEVGLGGRLDATNVVERPAATVITPVSIDHTTYLGDTLAAIAAEKAGILKRYVPCVVAAQPPDALAVIERAARRAAAPLLISGEHWHATDEGGRMVYQDDDGLMDLPRPHLVGRHQFENAGAAIAAVKAAGFPADPAAIAEGLVKVEWPARMQRLTHGHLVDLLPKGAELWLDGGHNEGGGQVLAAAMADLEERSSRPLTMIVGMLTTKDPRGFLDHFTGLARMLIAVPVPSQKAAFEPEALAAIAAERGIPAMAAPSIEAALRSLAGEIPPGRILIAGSLYLAGEALAENGTPPR